MPPYTSAWHYDLNTGTCHHNTGVTTTLVSPQQWCHHNTGVIATLVSSQHWCHHNTGGITTLVSSQHWCHHNTGVTQCHLLNLRISGLSVHTLTTLSDPPVARHVPSGLKHRALTSLSWASCWQPHIAATLARCALLRITYKLVDI